MPRPARAGISATSCSGAWPAAQRGTSSLLTATPHSGDDAAFYRLLGLLAPDFERLAEVTGTERGRLRERLANHFVQRRRPDIAEWHEGDIFPRRETKELTYTLSGDWEAFFNEVLDYCAEVVETGAGDEQRQRLNFWGTLALLRCSGSSPVAAVLALRTRAGDELGDEAREDLLDRIFDGDVDALVEDDMEPPAGGDNPALARLIGQAERLAGQRGDPKLMAASEHVAELVEAGFKVVVFCRFIATAHYVARHFRGEPDGHCRRRRDRRDASGRTRGTCGADRRSRRRQGAGRHRLPVGGDQSAGALRRRRSLRPLVEPDAP